MKFLWTDIKRSFANWGFLAGCLGLGALIAYNFVTESLHSGSPYYAIVNILAASGFTVFLPVFPVLGYASRFCGEYESGYYRLILARMKLQKFARIRIVSVALSGGGIVALPYLLICLAAVYLEAPELAASGADALRVESDIEMVVIGQTYGIGVMVAVWMPNPYVPLIAPFVLYESLYILMPGNLNPAALVCGDDAGHLWSVVLECVWLFAAAAVAMMGFRRRCGDA